MKTKHLFPELFATNTCRLMSYILFSIFIFAAFPSWATTYYVSSSTGSDSNPGTLATPWKTIAKVNSKTFLPGDTLLFKRGDVWKEGITMGFTESGTVSNPIVISAYGVGNKPIISDILPITGWNTPANWVNTSGNIWEMTYPTNPNRLWLNNSEALRSVILADVGTVNSQGTFEWWFYDTPSKTLSLYATSNPATQYSSIEGNGPSAVLGVYNSAYLIIDGIDFRGGIYSTIYLGSCSYITLKNCNIGYGHTGFAVTSANFTLTAHHIVIENNAFDSRFNFFYGLSSTGTNGEKRGNEDGINLNNAVNNCIIRNNTFTGWGHVAIYCYGANITYDGVHDNKIYNNSFTGTNNSYNRPLAADGVEGKCYNNEFYNNLIKNHTVRSQINGNNNWVHHNIFDGQTNTPVKPGTETGQAIGMAVYGIDLVCHDNKIDNNLFINTVEAAIVLMTWNFPAKVTNNYFRNNIFYNTGYNTTRPGDLGVAIIITNDLGESKINNVFQNNCVFNPGKPLTNAIKYYGAFKSVAQFNLQNGNNGNIINNNIQVDPLFVDYINSNYHLQKTSPCIDSGIVITGLTNDFDGNPIYTGADPDIGAYEEKAALTTYGYAQPQANSFDVRVSPNPSSTNFKLIVQSNSTEVITIRLMDVFGRVISIINKIQRNESVTVGNNLTGGTYFAEVTQGSNNKKIKLIKIN